MVNLQCESDLVERLQSLDYMELVENYEPTPSDWEEYRRHLEAEDAAEIMDRTQELERHRREQFDTARSAACRVRGIAAALASRGDDATAARLMHAAADVMIVLNQYA